MMTFIYMTIMIMMIIDTTQRIPQLIIYYSISSIIIKMTFIITINLALLFKFLLLLYHYLLFDQSIKYGSKTTAAVKQLIITKPVVKPPSKAITIIENKINDNQKDKCDDKIDNKNKRPRSTVNFPSAMTIVDENDLYDYNLDDEVMASASIINIKNVAARTTTNNNKNRNNKMISSDVKKTADGKKLNVKSNQMRILLQDDSDDDDINNNDDESWTKGNDNQINDKLTATIATKSKASTTTIIKGTKSTDDHNEVLNNTEKIIF